MTISQQQSQYAAAALWLKSLALKIKFGIENKICYEKGNIGIKTYFILIFFECVCVFGLTAVSVWHEREPTAMALYVKSVSSMLNPFLSAVFLIKKHIRMQKAKKI